MPIPSRSRLSLDGQWSFWIDPNNTLTPQTLTARQSSSLSIPAPWQSQSETLRHYTGIAWYQRTFELPGDWLDNRAIILGLGAVDYLAEVWINDIKVGEHEGGYLPFEFDISSTVQPGLNTVTVRIDDSLERFAEIPHGKQSWYGHLSGLWQSVWIESRSLTHIQHVRVTPNGQTVAVTITLNKPLDSNEQFACEISDPNGQVVAQAQSAFITCQLTVPNPLLWDIDTPNLYMLIIRIANSTDTNQPLDSVSETFGFRTIATQNGQLLLNGRPLYLRGALDQDYYPDLICTPPSVEYIEDQFRKAKAMGLNCLRTHIKVADPRYYAAADRLGLLIWTELPNHILLTENSKRRVRETLAGMVKRDWNHPSIIIWTIINESWGVDLKNAEHRTWLSEAYDYLKVLDPHRLVVGNSACLGNFHVVTDIEDFHNYYAIPDHYEQWHDWLTSFASHPHWTFAHVYETAALWREFAAAPWNAPVSPPAPEVTRQGDEPLVVSEFGNWGLPDVEGLRANNGGRDPWWFETGQEWGDGVVYPHGVEERFKTFHLDRAFPSFSHLVAASQHMQVVALKYEIEQMRRHASIQGYIITEFTDVHWESNGLLDMNRQAKAITTALPAFNADDVLIPECDRITLYTGESCSVKLSLSHYSAMDLSDSQLQWQLLLDESALPTQMVVNEQGVVLAPSPESASVISLGTITFTIPSILRNTRARLEFRLVTKTGELAASNYQELYFFQPIHMSTKTEARIYAPDLSDAITSLGYAVSASLFEADIALVTTVTDEHREYLLRGGRILWLAETDNAQQTVLEGLRLTPRKNEAWQGDWASTLTWLNQDRMFDEIPTDGLVDFAFADLTPNHVLTGFGPNEFAIDIHAGLFVGWIHKTVALIASRRIGRGEILISTFPLSQHLTTHPIAALMLRDMLVQLSARP